VITPLRRSGMAHVLKARDLTILFAHPAFIR